jgi:cysteine desulfurase
LERNIPLHIDAAQSAGKIALKLDAWGVRLCSLNAHKINGPKGIGALYLGNGIELAPILHGGEQQGGIRPGTLATHQIAGMGRAFELARPDEEGPRLRLLLEALWLGLSDIPGIQRAGDPAHTAPHILNVSFGGVDGESLRLALGDVAVSSGSACNSPSPDASYVLTSLGLSDARAQGSVRFGIGRFTTEDEIGSATARVQAAVRQLRACADGSPDWCRV